MARFVLRSVTPLAFAAALCLVGCGKKGPEIIDGNNGNNGNNGTNAGTNNGQTNNGGGGKINGERCASNDECQSNACRAGICGPPLCNDSVQNGDETDVDCGALGCPPCDIGQACELDNDCISGICQDATCVEKRCDDSDQNGLETDVDCGGQFCGPCDDGKRCKDDSDCVSLVCNMEVCAVPTCEDQTQNGTETGVDCGSTCEQCADGQGCGADTDCVSGVCAGDLCAVPSCEDMTANGAETDVDCGGADCGPCADGMACAKDVDCVSGVCDVATGSCSAPACDDGEMNGDETDVDCGGATCAPCLPRKKCLIGTDCISKQCDMNGECTTPACDDFIQNGDETDVDCGGSCGGCADMRMCTVGDDCRSLICQNGTCQPGGCSDGVLNGSETDVDCGGMCNKCLDMQVCSVNGDCLNGLCANGKCAAARCNDTIQNGTETDVDCGGSCAPCADGLSCMLGSDCTSGVCGLNNFCAAPMCPDTVKNGTETDIDCGGANCPQCTLGDECRVDTDCASGICDGGTTPKVCAICKERTKQTINQNCGFQGRGRVEQTCSNGNWVDTGCVGVYYRSCQEILDAGASLGDGMYELDPDGPASVYAPFDVVCDMTTDGGGWTEITKCVAKNSLNMIDTAIDAADEAKFGTECRYSTRDELADGHTYYLTFDFPAGYSEFRLNGYQIKANSGEGHTSDLGHVQREWNIGASANQGDVSFGNPTQLGPRDSFSRYSVQSCFDCVIDWPGGNITIQMGTTANKFRIGWGETGPESEGWIPWYEGTILLR